MQEEKGLKSLKRALFIAEIIKVHRHCYSLLMKLSCVLFLCTSFSPLRLSFTITPPNTASLASHPPAPPRTPFPRMYVPIGTTWPPNPAPTHMPVPKMFTPTRESTAITEITPAILSKLCKTDSTSFESETWYVFLNYGFHYCLCFAVRHMPPSAVCSRRKPGIFSLRYAIHHRSHTS